MRSRKHHHLSSPGLLTTYLTLRSLHLLEPSSASYLILETTSPARFVTNSACTMIIEHDVGYFMLLAAIIPLVLPALLGLIAVAVYYCCWKVFFVFYCCPRINPLYFNNIFILGLVFYLKKNVFQGKRSSAPPASSSGSNKSSITNRSSSLGSNSMLHTTAGSYSSSRHNDSRQQSNLTTTSFHTATSSEAIPLSDRRLSSLPGQDHALYGPSSK